jgi:hypothetical protein
MINADWPVPVKICAWPNGKEKTINARGHYPGVTLEKE